MKDPFLNVVECNTVIPGQIKDKPNNIKEKNEPTNNMNNEEWGNIVMDPFASAKVLETKIEENKQDKDRKSVV